MRKVAAILLVLALVLALSACGGANKENGTSSKADTAGRTLETSLWTLTYDPEVWSFDEDDLWDDETNSRIMMMIPEGEEYDYLANVEIRAVLDEPYDFRDMLVSYGFDQQEYVSGVYDTTSVGGVDCLVHEGEYWGDPALRYLNRVEGAGATVFIEIIGEYEDPRVDELLAGLTFKLTDTGSEDGPWYWEGEPFSGETRTVTVGSHTLTAQWLPITDLIMTDDVFNHTVAVLDDKVYIFGDGALNQYSFKGSSLVYKENIPLTGEYEAIQATDDGTLWLSGLTEPLAAFENGVMRANYEGFDQVSMHPSGEWGVSWFYSRAGAIITPKGDTLESTSISFPAVTGISSLTVDDNYIFVCGDVTDGTGHKVCLYTRDGTLWNLLTDETGGGLGSITWVTETENGFIGLDGNLREIVLWDKDGEHIAAIDDGELFGTRYPWFCHAAKLSDGSLLVIMTEERADRSATELVAFRLSGF